MTVQEVAAPICFGMSGRINLNAPADAIVCATFWQKYSNSHLTTRSIARMAPMDLS